MGLHSQLNDVGSDSILLLLVAMIATCFGHLCSLVASVFHSVAAVPRHHDHLHLSSGLASLIAISDHHLFLPPFPYSLTSGADDCRICLCTLNSGEIVRRLSCKHVFHKDCLDGWLHQMKLSCPLCRSPIVSQCRLDQERRRIAGDIANWFALR